MRQTWPVGMPPPDTFSLPREVFELSLKQGPLLVYLYLIFRKSLKCGADKMSYAVIGKAVGLCEKTVRTHLHTLANGGVDFAPTKSRINAGVTSDARQVTSARSADRFQGLPELFGVALNRRLFPVKIWPVASVFPQIQPSQRVGTASIKDLEV